MATETFTFKNTKEAETYLLENATFRQKESRVGLDVYTYALQELVQDMRMRASRALGTITMLQNEERIDQKTSWSLKRILSLGFLGRPGSTVQKDPKKREEQIRTLREKIAKADYLSIAEKILREQARHREGPPDTIDPLVLTPGEDAVIETGEIPFTLYYTDLQGREHSRQLSFDVQEDFYMQLSEREDGGEKASRLVSGSGVRMKNNNAEGCLEIKEGAIIGQPVVQGDGTIDNLIRLTYEKEGGYTDLDKEKIFEDDTLKKLHITLFLFLDPSKKKPRYVLRLHDDCPRDMRIEFTGDPETTKFRIMREMRHQGE